MNQDQIMKAAKAYAELHYKTETEQRAAFNAYLTGVNDHAKFLDKPKQSISTERYIITTRRR